MKEIIFLTEEAPEGGYIARALRFSIFTEADTMDELKARLLEAVRCHFEAKELPKIAHLYFAKDEIVRI